MVLQFGLVSDMKKSLEHGTIVAELVILFFIVESVAPGLSTISSYTFTTTIKTTTLIFMLILKGLSLIIGLELFQILKSTETPTSEFSLEETRLICTTPPMTTMMTTTMMAMMELTQIYNLSTLEYNFDTGCGRMGEELLRDLTIDHYHPSTFLSMDSISNPREESDRDMSRHGILLQPPDINVPLSVERSPPPHQAWNHEAFDMLDVSLGYQINEPDKSLDMSKVGRKCAKRFDSVWGAWCFFSFYFKPVLKENLKCNIVIDNNGVSGFDKTDVDTEMFLVQHDMENMYMWVFKERPENALGKMQLRNYMNGHSRQGERSFPFSVDKGFLRSHRMQRKHYRGLSNPQCLHGIELVSSPNLMVLDEEEQKKWMKLTGRDLSFSVPPEAKDFSSWRTLPSTDFELERPLPPSKNTSHHSQKNPLNGSGLNLSTHVANHSNGNGVDATSTCNKKRKEPLSNGIDIECCLPSDPVDHLEDADIHPAEPRWMNEFSGVMRNTRGPVTAAKTIYEDEEGYLIIISLPFVDPQRLKVHWWNNLTHGIVKISSVSTACTPYIHRNDRTYKLTDQSPEHCPPGEFKREIPLPTRIPDDAKLEAYFDKSGTVLEIKVPKHRAGPEEHEVPVCLRPPNDFALS